MVGTGEGMRGGGEDVANETSGKGEADTGGMVGTEVGVYVGAGSRTISKIWVEVGMTGTAVPV